MPVTALVCPSCKQTSRTARELRPQAKIRCAHCGTVSHCFVHGNGAVELRLPPPPVPIEPGVGGQLPPRVADDVGFKRTILTRARKSRPIGGYAPFEKSRSYLGSLTLVAAIGLGGFAAYWYCSQITTIQKATGRSAGNGNIWKSSDDARRKEYLDRQKKAMKRLEAKEAGKDGQPSVGRQP